jgi:hypothetical protein
MFDYVYPSILGKREFMISEDNYGDVENYLTNLFGELAQHMSIQAINNEFEDPINAVKASHNKSWKPFARAAKLKETIVEKTTKTTNFSKWSRVHKESDHYYNQDMNNNTNSTNTNSKSTNTTSPAYLQKASTGNFQQNKIGEITNPSNSITVQKERAMEA